MPSRVRVTAAVCENCGPCQGSRRFKGQEIDEFPYVIPASVAREAHAECEACGGQVRVQTEPVEEEAK